MEKNLLKYMIQEQKVLLEYGNVKGYLEIITDEIARVYIETGSEIIQTGALCDDVFPSGSFEVKEQDGVICISTPKMIIKVRDELKIDFYDTDGNIVCKDFDGKRTQKNRLSELDKALLEQEGHSASEEEEYHYTVIKDLQNIKAFYGLGDKTGYLNKKGYMYEMWNTDNPDPQLENFKALYKSIPFLIALTDTSCYGLYFDTSYHSYFDMGSESDEYYYIAAEAGNIDYYYIAGENISDVITGYTYLTGRMTLPQLFALGYHQSRWSYASKNEVREIADNMRKNRIPCDVIHFDIDYMENYKVFTFDDKRFENADEFIRDLAKDGFKVVTIIDPGVKKEEGYYVYEEGIKNGYFVKNPDGTVYENEVWPGESVFPDFGNEDVRKWWGGLHEKLVNKGVRGIWNDMNEPASFKGPLPDNIVFRNGDRKTSHKEMHNLYGHYMAKATYEGMKKYDKRRPFVITRACFAGSQKYTTAWTGDNHSLWVHLQMAIPQLLNLSMSGMAFVGTDIGGFGSDATAELMARWIQVGCFSPLFRNHSAMGTKYQEPWRFGKEVLDIYRKYVELRYTLIPYFYDLFHECEKTGIPVLRPLILHYSNDKEVVNMNDEFMVGENILVSPVVNQGQTKKLVYLPEGKWYDYFTKELYEGGQYIIKDSPLDTCPIFVKAGSLIPKYPVMQYIGEKVIDTLELDYYPGEKAEYIHYLDDGESFDYLEGKYNCYRISYDGENAVKEYIHKGFERDYKDCIIKNTCTGVVKTL